MLTPFFCENHSGLNTPRSELDAGKWMLCLAVCEGALNESEKADQGSVVDSLPVSCKANH